MIKELINESERELLIEAEIERETPMIPGKTHGLRIDTQMAQSVAEPLVGQGYLRRSEEGDYEITDKGQELIIEMVGLR